MQKIKIKFIGTGFKDQYQAHVIIYDNNCNIVYNGCTYNGIINIHIKEEKAYKLIALSNGDIISTIFYVKPNKCEYIFIFKRSIYYSNNNIITFILTDYYYNNLPIEKGELILWPSQ